METSKTVKWRYLAGAALAALAMPLATSAAPINMPNIRPVVVNAAPGSEASLNTILNGMVSSLPSNYATTGQSTAGVFRFTTAPGTSVPTVVAEFTANAATQTFGIWFGTDTSSVYSQTIFRGGAAPGSIFTSTAVIGITGNTLEIGGFGASYVNSGTFIDPRVNPYAFGFFFSPNGGATKYFSVDQLNASSQTRFLAYNLTGNDWAFAYEDGTDFDYNDMVVKVESITVPEPDVLALLAVGLLSLGVAFKRRS